LGNFRSGGAAQAQAVADDMIAFFTEADELPIQNVYLLHHAVTALQATGYAPGILGTLGMIGDYYDCLEDECDDSGLCWDAQQVIACHACPGQPWYEAAAAALIYEIAMVGCLVQTPICQVLC
jgi:hypothetical protein